MFSDPFGIKKKWEKSHTKHFSRDLFLFQYILGALTLFSNIVDDGILYKFAFHPSKTALVQKKWTIKK